MLEPLGWGSVLEVPMNRCRCGLRLRIALGALVVGVSPWPASARAVAVEFVPDVVLVSGPPYPTGALTADTLVRGPGGPLVVDRLSMQLAAPNPLGAIDYAIADTFSFGVEREMKESGEKSGTEDITIGVGELMAFALHFSTDLDSASLQDAAVSGARVAFQTTSPAGRVAYASLFTTDQAAEIVGLSLVPGSDGRSFELHFRLLFSAPYVEDRAILRERQSGHFTPLSEPSALGLAGLLAFGLARRRRSARATPSR
jgi:MYXO-CTERM domain-containing protein